MIDRNVARWKYTAYSVGFNSRHWRKLACIMSKESHGNPRAYNGKDPHGGSRGLMQINGINHKWLKEAGVIRSSRDLYNPRRNLRAAYLIYRSHGWSAWSTSGSC